MAIKIKAKIKEKPVKEIFIDIDFIRLDSFLKMCDAVQTGGHAKIVIQEGEVRVNGEVCTQRGKKLREAISEKLHFASLDFQSLDGIIKAIGIDKSRLCTYCWDGQE